MEDVSVKDPLHTFFNPRGAAIIGASSNPNKLGHGVIRNIVEHGYAGAIYPINPRGGEILGLPVYPSVGDAPDPVDLGVIILSADYAATALEECGRRGVKAVVIISGGFGELGIHGREREQELREIARRYDVRFIGPNCVGVIDTYAPIDTTFVRTMPSRGRIGFVSHSGAVCGGTIDWANAVGVGFSRVMSLGNQVDVDVADSLDSLAAEPHTRVVAAYIEGLPNGRKFVESAARLTRRKPLVVLKAGRTPSGTRAVTSHTGALSGTDKAFMAACRRAGAIPVENLEQLIDGSLALAYRRPPAGMGIAILTNAGGPAAVGADALDRQGLRLVDLSPETQARLREVGPPGTQTGNPVDLLGGPRPEQFAQALAILIDAPEVDGVMLVYVPQAITPPQDIADAVSGVIGDGGNPGEKPIVCNIAGGGGIRRAARTLHAHDVPHYITPARAAFGLGALWRYGQIQAQAIAAPGPVSGVDRERARTLLGTLLGTLSERAIGKEMVDSRVMDPQAGADLAAAYGLTTPPSGLAGTVEAAVALVERIGYPAALKRVAPGVVHKADVGGVVLGLSNADDVRAAFERVVGLGEQAFIQRMAPRGVDRSALEVIVGAQRDEQFGPLVMFGLGGAYVEVLRDVAFRLAPLSEADARDMAAETAAGKLLAGVRGQPPGDLDAVVDALRRVGQLMADQPAVAEVDLNPLIVGRAGEGAWAVDVRIVLDKN